MKRKFLEWLARKLRVQAYFEVLSIAPEDFAEFSHRRAIGIPVYMNWEIVAEGMQPKPERVFRLYIQ